MASYLQKTDKGREEVRTRQSKLPAKSRMLLMLADGRVGASQLVEKGKALGLDASAVQQLLDEGFIELFSDAAAAQAAQTAPAAESKAGQAQGGGEADASELRFRRYREARGFMTQSIGAALGLKAFMFTLRIERTANMEDLAALYDDYVKAMTKELGESGAKMFASHMRGLLGD